MSGRKGRKGRVSLSAIFYLYFIKYQGNGVCVRARARETGILRIGDHGHHGPRGPRLSGDDQFLPVTVALTLLLPRFDPFFDAWIIVALDDNGDTAWTDDGGIAAVNGAENEIGTDRLSRRNMRVFGVAVAGGDLPRDDVLPRH